MTTLKRQRKRKIRCTKAKPHLAQAEHAAKKDAEFTDKEQHRQKTHREKSIQRSKELNAKLQDTKLKL